MKKRILTVFVLLMLFGITLYLCAYSCGGQRRDYREVFEINWKMILPENLKELFRKSEDNWGHFGIRYAVFELEEEPSEFIEDFDKGNNNEFENIVSKLLDVAKFDIPEKYLPDWSEQYCWKKLEKEYHYSETDIVTDECYIIYFNNLNKLAICQYFP